MVWVFGLYGCGLVAFGFGLLMFLGLGFDLVFELLWLVLAPVLAGLGCGLVGALGIV